MVLIFRENILNFSRAQFWRRQWHPTPVLLPGKSHGWRSLVGCSPWGRSELDTTERLHFHFSLSYIGEGNGNPLQCSCLENPRDRGAWWAAVYRVAQSRTRLKWLSIESNLSDFPFVDHSSVSGLRTLFLSVNLKGFLLFFFLKLLFIYFILFFNFTILYWFCHISKWIRHRYTFVPHPEPSSLLPPHTIPLGHPNAPAPSIQYCALNLDWRLISYMILYMFQCHSPKSSHPIPLPQSPKGCSIHQYLFCSLIYYI